MKLMHMNRKKSLFKVLKVYKLSGKRSES